jgi:hypothetical protein
MIASAATQPARADDDGLAALLLLLGAASGGDAATRLAIANSDITVRTPAVSDRTEPAPSKDDDGGGGGYCGITADGAPFTGWAR